MHLPTALLALLCSTLSFTTATPHPQRQPSSNPTNFYLVTTTQSTPTKNSSHLDNVSATSLFDPFDQQAYLLRLIGPGYLSLPQFNLTHGTLHSLSEGPEGFGEFVYNSTRVRKGRELKFLAKGEGRGNLGLEGGYLLSVKGETEGWSICAGPEGEDVIVWKGNSTCTHTYIQAVKKPPY